MPVLVSLAYLVSPWISFSYSASNDEQNLWYYQIRDSRMTNILVRLPDYVTKAMFCAAILDPCGTDQHHRESSEGSLNQCVSE
jgi:hypothetical protein